MKKRNWSSLIYIIPWAIGSLGIVTLGTISIIKHFGTQTPLSYGFWVDSILMITALRLPFLDWMDELKKEGFL